MDAAKESLEERLERIRLKNEEIEKRHREAEEDRHRALQDNAMVEVKPVKHEDWPTQHKYDTLDFTYDVDPEAVVQQETRSADATLSPSTAAVSADGAPTSTAGRKKKTFTEGDGPPPDPAYNFLADSERDGSQEQQPKNNNNTNPFRNKSANNNSFRRQTSGSGGAAAAGNTPSGNNNNSKGKREFNTNNNKSTAPKKNLETNWRERDNVDKTSESSTAISSTPKVKSPPQSPVVDDSAVAATYHQKKPLLPLSTPKQPLAQTQLDKRPPALRAIVSTNNNQQPKTPVSPVTSPTVVRQPMIPGVKAGVAAEQSTPKKDIVPEKLVVEQRGNIQISVSKDGEIQSVKCEYMKNKSLKFNS